MRSPLLLAAASLAAPALLAQTSVVFPPVAAKAEGVLAAADYKTGAPWVTLADQAPDARNFRYQLISDLPAATKGNLTALAFRRDGVVGGGNHTENFSIDIELTLSTAQTKAASAVTSFAGNSGADALTVIARKIVRIGALNYFGGFPEPFGIRLPFDKPFAYDAAKGSLCYDLKHWDNTLYDPIENHGQQVYVDAVQSSMEAPTLKNGPRCASSNPWYPPLEFSQHLSLTKDASNKPVLGYWAERFYGDHHSYGLLVLTFAKHATGYRFDCGTFMLDMSTMLLMTLEASDDHGNIRWPMAHHLHENLLFQVPYEVRLGGVQLWGQEINLDVHDLSTQVTNWQVSQIPTWLGDREQLPMRAVYASGPGSLIARGGTLGDPGVGPVLEYSLGQ